MLNDSQLRKLNGKCKCTSKSLIVYHDLALLLLDQFDEYELFHIPRSESREANAIAQAASGLILQGSA